MHCVLPDLWGVAGTGGGAVLTSVECLVVVANLFSKAPPPPRALLWDVITGDRRAARELVRWCGRVKGAGMRAIQAAYVRVNI